jgi:carbon monoxide dehydrogenase subunit G
MIRIEESTQISRPRDEVFDFLTNVDNLPKWQSGVVQSRRLTQGAVRVGFQYEEVVKVGPWKLNAVCTVTDLKANERFAFQMKTSGPLDCDGRFDLQPAAGGTRLTISGSARLKGVWRLMQPVFGGDLRKETRTELATIKLLLEADGQAVANRALASQ